MIKRITVAFEAGRDGFLPGCGKRCATFRDEDVGRRWGFA